METTTQSATIVWHTDSLWTSTNVDKVNASLHKFHAENITVEKKGEANINATVKRKYVKLDDIMNVVRPVLAKYDCFIEQHLAGDSVITRIVHVSGQFIASKLHYQTWEANQVNNLQRLGGGLSYLKRYAISAILNIVADEDTDGDGNDNVAYKKPNVDAVSQKQPMKANTDAVSDDREWLNVTAKNGSITPKGEASINYIKQGGALADIQKKYRINKTDLAMLQALEKHAQAQIETQEEVENGN